MYVLYDSRRYNLNRELKDNMYVYTAGKDKSTIYAYAKLLINMKQRWTDKDLPLDLHTCNTWFQIYTFINM